MHLHQAHDDRERLLTWQRHVPTCARSLQRVTTSRYTTADASTLEDFQCQICLGTLRACVALEPCGHNFCAACLSHHFASQLMARAPRPLSCDHPLLRMPCSAEQLMGSAMRQRKNLQFFGMDKPAWDAYFARRNGLRCSKAQLREWADALQYGAQTSNTLSCPLRCPAPARVVPNQAVRTLVQRFKLAPAPTRPSRTGSFKRAMSMEPNLASATLPAWAGEAPAPPATSAAAPPGSPRPAPAASTAAAAFQRRLSGGPAPSSVAAAAPMRGGTATPEEAAGQHGLEPDQEQGKAGAEAVAPQPPQPHAQAAAPLQEEPEEDAEEMAMSALCPLDDASLPISAAGLRSKQV
jgi:hypothetical protein